MSENLHGGDAAQIIDQQYNMCPDELVGEMADLWDAMDEENYDPSMIDIYLDALDKKIPLSIDTEASLAAFREKHARLLEQVEPVIVFSNKKPGPRPRRHMRVMRLAAASLLVILVCMITAQALGFDVIGVVARWTDEIFYFNAPAQTESGPVSAPPAGLEFSNLQEALSAYGITESAAPGWVPPEFHLIEIKVIPTPKYIKLHAAYEDGERFWSVIVQQYAAVEDANSVIFEKDDRDVVLYEKGGIEHYLMSNNARITAAWINNTLMCSLSGDISVDEAKQMIDSIYST